MWLMDAVLDDEIVAKLAAAGVTDTGGLNAFVFTKGNQTVTIYTDLDAVDYNSNHFDTKTYDTSSVA